MSKKQTGFTIYEVVIVLVVLALIGLSAWMIISRNNSSKVKTQASSEQTTKSTDPNKTTISSVTKYSNSRFTANLPIGWKLDSSEGDLSGPDNEYYTFKNADQSVKVNLVKYGKDAVSNADWRYSLGADRTVTLKDTPLELSCDAASTANAYTTCPTGNSATIFMQPATEISFKGISGAVYLSFYANTGVKDNTLLHTEDIISIVNSIKFNE